MAAGAVTVSLTSNNASKCNIFDGADDYVEIPHNTRQLGASLTNGFTISAWICPRSIGEGAGTIIGKNNAGTTAQAGFSWKMSSNNKVSFQVNVGSVSVTSNNSVPYKTWTHILITISSAQLTNNYVNGVLSGAANQDLVQGIAAITSTSVVHIGNNSLATDRTFDGSIRSVKMWNKVLSSTERAQDYAGIIPAKDNLIHHFKLGGDYADYGIVGVTATNSGSVPQVVDSNIAVAVKAQRVGASDKFMCYRGIGGQVGTVAIEE